MYSFIVLIDLYYNTLTLLSIKKKQITLAKKEKLIKFDIKRIFFFNNFYKIKS